MYKRQGTITEEYYMQKLEKYITDKTQAVLAADYRRALRPCFDAAARFYKNPKNEKESKAVKNQKNKKTEKKETKQK